MQPLCQKSLHVILSNLTVYVRQFELHDWRESLLNVIV